MTPEYYTTMLELVPTDELYLELARRFEDLILHTSTPRPDSENDTRKVVSMRWKGDPRICQGLACGVIASCEEWIQKDLTDIPKEEL
jgi:hypothetical protein